MVLPKVSKSRTAYVVQVPNPTAKKLCQLSSLLHEDLSSYIGQAPYQVFRRDLDEHLSREGSQRTFLIRLHPSAFVLGPQVIEVHRPTSVQISF